MPSDTATPIDHLMAEVQERIEGLRAELRAKAPVRATLPDAYKLNGDVYVESVGTIARIANGTGEFFYTPDAAQMRGPVLQQLAVPRRDLFKKIGRQLKPKSRVLMAGAGSDVDSIESLLAEGHEVIATDFAEDVVQALRRRVTVPAFACDLIHLDRVLPEPVDYVLANSVLGYLDPGKAKKVVANLWAACSRGAIFSFDQTPNPHYFEAAAAQTEQTLVNASGADPRKLTAYIEALGVSAGIAAMALYVYHRGRAVNFAIISVIAELFASHGASTALGDYDLVVPGKGTHPDPILRVAKTDQDVLLPVDGETHFANAREALEADVGAKPWLQLVYVDREAAVPLARALGIHTNARADAWAVMQYVAENGPSEPDLNSQRAAVLTELDPSLAAQRIRAVIDAGEFVPTKRMRKAVMVDQTIHKGVALGSMPVTPERADIEIDRVYSEERQRSMETSARVRAGDAERARREKQKQQKKDRKKQRR